jgi:ABC-type transporter Mla MlaB component
LPVNYTRQTASAHHELARRSLCQKAADATSWDTFAMLSINCVPDADQAPTLKLEGKLKGLWVEELRDTCRELQPERMRLDLSALTFVDAAGAKLLGDLIRQGAQLISWSGYVAELLHVRDR